MCFKEILILLLGLAVFFPSVGLSQHQSSVLSGTIEVANGEMGLSLIGVPVQLVTLNSVTNKIVAINIANVGDDFLLDISYSSLPSDSLVLFAKGFNIRSDSLQVVCKQPCALNGLVINVEHESIAFDTIAVIGEAPNYRLRGDTLSFSAGAYLDSTAQHVRLITLLESIPGIKVNDENGAIEYRGRSLDALLINGRDVFKANYQVAVRSIKAEIVDKIEAISDYHPESLTKGLFRSKEVAINIVTKKNARSVSGEFGGGGGPKSYVGQANLFGLGGNSVSFGSMRVNNIGRINDYRYVSSFAENVAGGVQHIHTNYNAPGPPETYDNSFKGMEYNFDAEINKNYNITSNFRYGYDKYFMERTVRASLVGLGGGVLINSIASDTVTRRGATLDITHKIKISDSTRLTITTLGGLDGRDNVSYIDDLVNMNSFESDGRRYYGQLTALFTRRLNGTLFQGGLEANSGILQQKNTLSFLAPIPFPDELRIRQSDVGMFLAFLMPMKKVLGSLKYQARKASYVGVDQSNESPSSEQSRVTHGLAFSAKSRSNTFLAFDIATNINQVFYKRLRANASESVLEDEVLYTGGLEVSLRKTLNKYSFLESNLSRNWGVPKMREQAGYPSLVNYQAFTVFDQPTKSFNQTSANLRYRRDKIVSQNETQIVLSYDRSNTPFVLSSKLVDNFVINQFVEVQSPLSGTSLKLVASRSDQVHVINSKLSHQLALSLDVLPATLLEENSIVEHTFKSLVSTTTIATSFYTKFNAKLGYKIGVSEYGGSNVVISKSVTSNFRFKFSKRAVISLTLNPTFITSKVSSGNFISSRFRILASFIGDRLSVEGGIRNLLNQNSIGSVVRKGQVIYQDDIRLAPRQLFLAASYQF